MENNQRNSRKRLNSLILLVAFTAVMLIISTYAWFSTQKNVTLNGLKGTVNVAEGLQISLDAEHWVNTINFDDFDQTDATAWTVKSTSASTYLGSGKTFQSPRGDTTIKNVVPTELLPVSTTGYEATNDGIGQSAVKFYEGTNTETIKLMNDTNVVTEDAAAGFFAFDLFLMNTSAEGVDTDVLQLDPVSDVKGDNESTGVQNTARVAFALYENDGDDVEISGDNVIDAAAIIAGTSTGKTITDVAIWEPNANQHASSIVSSPANSIKLDSTDQATYSSLTHNYGSGKNNTSTFTTTDILPTYALTSASIASPVGDGNTLHIADVYDWRLTDSSATAAKGVKRQFTLQTNAYESGSALSLRAAPVNLVSTMKSEDNAATPNTHNNTTFDIVANQYQKIRVYFWMEGQDPDCINSASLGGGLTLDIGFSKPGSDNSGAN